LAAAAARPDSNQFLLLVGGIGVHRSLILIWTERDPRARCREVSQKTGKRILGETGMATALMEIRTCADVHY
ncbi:MAG TPA: hypothetical protein VN788_10655, partial [Verrucomicrobiae bacterium]|nr:hypothetical protein [Verrucomicrobiae bacterium]